jgi:hypothetical protein
MVEMDVHIEMEQGRRSAPAIVGLIAAAQKVVYVKKIYTHINDKGSFCFGRATFISYIRLFGVVK